MISRRCRSPQLLLLASVCCALTPVARALDIHRPEIRQFMAHMNRDLHVDKSVLKKLLREAQSQSTIIDAMNRPAEKAKLWYEYRQIFITEKRIRDGMDFWSAHRRELEQAALRTGVAPEFIVAILGVETQYGRQTGRYRVLDALATLAFDYPPRATFFLSELEQFLLLTREAGIDPLLATGSYAGAMGAPQFMPSSYRNFGVDANADGHIDLWTNWLDVFTSIGNYFKEHGWRSGEPSMVEAWVDARQSEGLDGRKLSLSATVGSLHAAGVRFDSDMSPAAPAFLIAVDSPDGVNWRVGFQNFYVITRYNHSALYAMAASELAAAIKGSLAQAQWPLLNRVDPAAVFSMVLP